MAAPNMKMGPDGKPRFAEEEMAEAPMEAPAEMAAETPAPQGSIADAISILESNMAGMDDQGKQVMGQIIQALSQIVQA